MTQSITAPLKGDFISGPGMTAKLADQTVTTAAQQLARGANWFALMLYLKTFVVGTGTILPTFSLEVADDAAFSLNVRELGAFDVILTRAIAAIPSVNPPITMFLDAFAPDGAKTFWRIRALYNGTSTGIFDVSLAAT